MIKTFACKKTKLLFETGKTTGFLAAIESQAKRKLAMLPLAISVEDLKVPPVNRLEALKGDRKGQHSIRINDQYRICFRFSEGNAENVEIIDYHR